MKNFIIFFGIAAFTNISAQVAINKNTVTPGASLEFKDNTGRGLVLPYVTTNPGNPSGYPGVVSSVPGTLIMDLDTKQVKIRSASGWTNLSNGAATSNLVDTTIQDNKTELPKAKVSIGLPVDDQVAGILVLEENNKAMILPRESSYKNIKNPAAGMIVYDTTDNLLCVYNGTEWAFWAGE